MREVIAVCRSRKAARPKTAAILDRYFWRIGDRTWRGRASNACLDRVARELRQAASRAMAVSIQEVRSSHESRLPLIRIGSKSAFSDRGLTPIASHPASRFRGGLDPRDRHALALVRISALFHDLGKATTLFQEKLQRSLAGGAPEADAVRHELFSAVVWDQLFGSMDDRELIEGLGLLTPELVDAACSTAIDVLVRLASNGAEPLRLAFAARPDRIAFAIGMLILTHHRLPEGGSNHRTLLAGRHVRSEAELSRASLQIADGEPFWHEAWWLRRLRRETLGLATGSGAPGLDIALRATLMFADHIGSARKQQVLTGVTGHLANTKDGAPADNLSIHVRKVVGHCRGAYDMLRLQRDRFPAIEEDALPFQIRHPAASDPRFAWQSEAAEAARSLCASGEGGFFGCILSGTGSGKTRGAPTILAAAAFGDVRPERRYLRMTLSLGLRALATQSAREYVDQLGFRDEDVAVLVGQSPIEFEREYDATDAEGSESLQALPEWLRVERVAGSIPEPGTKAEEDWLRGLGLCLDRGIPAFCDMVAEASRDGGRSFRDLVSSPLIVATVDHIMSVAAPVTSRFLAPAVRVGTSDLILDEIDQYDPEDIAAIGRLIHQAGAAGRRVIVMSATLTADVAEALHAAYAGGWSEFARSSGGGAQVNALCVGDAPGACVTTGELGFLEAYRACRDRMVEAVRRATPLRRGAVLPERSGWDDLVGKVDAACTDMHEVNASRIDGFRVSVGLIGMTRIAHTAALAMQLPAGEMPDRLRVKVCLHANFPRLHRAWIETRLRRALTRKGPDANAGLRSLCTEEGLFERAEALGARDIEIVCVSSPVIQTGNDLDFDYALLDPISMRSIIQAAGRVRRHRLAPAPGINVKVLGRSPIVMQSGRLAKPGVETAPHQDTAVARRNLDRFGRRLFADLWGNAELGTITAADLLSGEGYVPLRDEEAALRGDMISAAPDDPLGTYIRDPLARLNLRFTRSRAFRRSTLPNIQYVLQGENVEDAEWMIDLAPGMADSRLVPAAGRDLHPHEAAEGDGWLFQDMTQRAWFDFSGGVRDMTAADMRRLLCVEIPDYTRGDEPFPEMSVCEVTGFTRGAPHALHMAFGSSRDPAVSS